MAEENETHHGSRERVGWSIEVGDDTASTPNGSITTYGTNEAQARSDYARRAKAMHRGKTIRLVRRITAEAWVTHADTIERVVKPSPDAEATR